MKKIIGLLLGASLLILAIWFFGFRGSATNGSAGFQIETAVVERGDVARLVSAAGSVRALTTVEVGSQVSGQILELNADFNSEVTAGQIVARIDAQTFLSRVASAEAEVTSARANIEVQRAQIARAEANLENFEKNHVRQQALYAEDAVALSVLEDTERQLAVARSDLAVAKAQYRTGQAALTQRLASLQTQNVDLERTIIRSPITGVVIERNVDVGQTVAASLSAPVLFRIAQDLSDIRIDVAVVESDIGGIDAGDPVTFKVDAYPEDDFTGTVEQVRLAAQEIQNVVTYTVVVAAENLNAKLLPGMTANVEITTEKRKDVLRIAEAVSRFRPPIDGPEVVTPDTGENRTRGGAGGLVAQSLRGLDVTPERTAEIGQEITREMQTARKNFGEINQFNRSRFRQVMTARIDRVLKKTLTKEEYKTLQASRNARAATRRIQLYQENEDGTLRLSNVVVGLSDGSFLEVIDGAEEGDVFVMRLRKAKTGN